MATIIDKIEYINGGVVYTPVGYCVDDAIITQINQDYNSTLNNWIETNRTDLESGVKYISEFFDSTPVVHIAKTGTSYDVSLPEITDINEL